MAAALVLGNVELLRVAAVDLNLQAHLPDRSADPELRPQMPTCLLEIRGDLLALGCEKLGAIDEMLPPLRPRQIDVLAEKVAEVDRFPVLALANQQAIVLAVVFDRLPDAGAAKFVREHRGKLLRRRRSAEQEVEQAHRRSSANRSGANTASLWEM